MAELPANIATIWVIGRWIDLAGQPLRGAVTFAPAVHVLVDQDEHTVILARSFVAQLDATGTAAIRLPATDDPDIQPVGWTYLVQEPTVGRRYDLVVPHGTPLLDRPGHPLHGQQVIDLADIDPAAASGGVVVPPSIWWPDGGVLLARVDTLETAGQVRLTAVAAAPLSGHRIVTPAVDGNVDYASAATPGHLHAPLWLTRGAVAAGGTAQLLAYGPIVESSWSWTPGPVYLGTSGLLTQAAPAAPGAAFLAQVGYATSATRLVVDRQPSIALS